MPEKNNLTIIIPIYNAQKYIKTCISSLLNQTVNDFSVVLVDDGSEDQSLQICKELVRADDRFRIIEKKKNCGVMRARLEGLESAYTDYVTFMDADDFVEKDHVEIMLGLLETHPADMIIEDGIYDCGDKIFSLKNQFKSGLYTSENLKSIFERSLCYREFFEFGILPYLWNKVFKREWITEEHQKMDPSIYDGEDVGLIWSYMMRCKSLYFSDKATYHYCVCPESLSRKRRDDFIDNCSKLYLHLSNTFKSNDYYEIMRPQLDQYMRMMIYKSDESCFIFAKKFYFPFAKVEKGSRIIIYGAGVVGRNYLYDLRNTDYCQVVGCVDRNFDNLKEVDGFTVTNPKDIPKMEHDCVVIAISDSMLSSRIKDYLVHELSEESSKIVF